jgi:hypothetical protein
VLLLEHLFLCLYQMFRVREYGVRCLQQ